jgi:CRISPR/Cas system-associated exonuclease Cas4 (RecB family)
MQAFLNRVAKHIVEKYPSDHLDQICIVLPNRRGGIYFQKHLANYLGKTSWAPSIFSIEDFIEKLSGLQSIDPVFLLFELYNVHREVEKDNAVDFIQFLSWGQVLLSDFNEVDQYLVDADQLFSYLSDTKAISLWNPSGVALTEFQLKYLEFFRSLKQYYQILTKKLLSKNKAYQGLIYRFLAENIEDKIQSLEYKRVVFAGFNAFSKAEKEIIDALIKSGASEALYDSDAYYMEDDIQEAGKFLRALKSESENFKWIEKNFKNDKSIKIIGVAKNIGQVKYTGELLSAVDPSQIENTAVVLNDESLLYPILNSIPANIEEINLTMGLPLNQTSLYDLLRSIYLLHTNSLKFNKKIKDHQAYYYRDIITILENKFLQLSISDTENIKAISTSVNLIRTSNKTFYTGLEILDLITKQAKGLENLYRPLFSSCGDSPIFLLSQFDAILKSLQKALFLKKQNEQLDFLLEFEYVYQFSKVVNALSDILTEVDFITSLNSFVYIFDQIVSSVRIPFSGEPLQGLQIMGMLETRTLDFENVIMLSVNEGMIPAGKSANSFIPHELKVEFDLPTYKEKDAIFAYHFYRLIQRAKHFTILYNTEAGDLGGGDRSRFINQIVEEFPKYNPGILIAEEVLNIKIKDYKAIKEIKIYKTPDILAKLKEKASKGFSPSKLNIYRQCSLRYYFHQIAGIDEQESVQETIEANTLGTVVHEVLKHLYLPFKNKNISDADIKLMLPHVEKTTISNFKLNYAQGDLEYGKNLLIVKVAVLFIENFLKTEIKFLAELAKENKQLFIKNLEEQFESAILIETKEESFNVNLKGWFDRVDELNDQIRVIDYKTGFVKSSDLGLSHIEELLEKTDKDKSFQLLFYAYLFLKSNPAYQKEVIPGIITFRALSEGLLTVKLKKGDLNNNEIIIQFESVLKQIFFEIFDSEIPFTQTENIKNCEYCPFTNVCSRT